MSGLVNKRKILFVLPSLVSGGAEKVAVQLLNNLNREKYTPAVVLFERKGDFLRDLHHDIEVFDLKKKSRISFPRLIFSLANLIKKNSPALVVSFLIYSNFIVLLASMLIRIRVPVLITEHSVPLYSMKAERHLMLRKAIFRWLYPRAEKIITVTEGIRNELKNYWGIPADKITVVNNSVDLRRIRTLSREPANFESGSDVPKIIAVGRLCEPKGYPYLLKAMKQVKTHSPVHLYILGDGELRRYLERLAQEQGISDSVFFLGFQNNPYKYISKATLFVQASLWESFSIVLVEAMACSVPVISTRCPYGPEEIITDGVNGLLVPVANETALAEAIKKLLNDNDCRRRLIVAGKKRAENFGIEKMVNGYTEVFEQQIDSVKV